MTTTETDVVTIPTADLAALLEHIASTVHGAWNELYDDHIADVYSRVANALGDNAGWLTNTLSAHGDEWRVRRHEDWNTDPFGAAWEADDER